MPSFRKGYTSIAVLPRIIRASRLSQQRNLSKQIGSSTLVRSKPAMRYLLILELPGNDL